MASVSRLYFITSDEGPGHKAQAELACRSGIRLIQLRMKHAEDEVFFETALAIKKICKVYGASLIINDRVSIAAAVNADGVHLGQEDQTVAAARGILGEEAIIGGTANTIDHIREHHRQGADYIGLGPLRYTTTKKKLSPILGLEGYRSIFQQMKNEGIALPVVAIGGVQPDDLSGLLEAGAYGIAFSGMLTRAAEPATMVKMLEAKFLQSLAG